MRHVNLMLLALLLAALTQGCGLVKTKGVAEKKAGELYDKLAADQIEDVLNMYAPVFYTKITREQWRNALLNLRERLGTYQSRRLINWNVRSNFGTGGARTITTLVYRVKYSKAESTETLVFLGGEKNIKLVGHYISSPALIPTGPPPKSLAATGQHEETAKQSGSVAATSATQGTAKAAEGVAAAKK